jgi:transcriptional regulator with XRE-family HTH domain
VTVKFSAQTRRRLQEIAAQLVRIRELLGISKHEAARRIGMHIGNYSKIERAEKNLTVDTLLMLADGLDLKLAIKFTRRRDEYAKLRKALTHRTRVR